MRSAAKCYILFSLSFCLFFSSLSLSLFSFFSHFYFHFISSYLIFVFAVLKFFHGRTCVCLYCAYEEKTMRCPHWKRKKYSEKHPFSGVFVALLYSLEQIRMLLCESVCMWYLIGNFVYRKRNTELGRSAREESEEKPNQRWYRVPRA